MFLIFEVLAVLNLTTSPSPTSLMTSGIPVSLPSAFTSPLVSWSFCRPFGVLFLIHLLLDAAASDLRACQRVFPWIPICFRTLVVEWILCRNSPLEVLAFSIPVVLPHPPCQSTSSCYNGILPLMPPTTTPWYRCFLVVNHKSRSGLRLDVGWGMALEVVVFNSGRLLVARVPGVSPGIAAWGQIFFAVSKDMPECCWWWRWSPIHWFKFLGVKSHESIKVAQSWVLICFLPSHSWSTGAVSLWDCFCTSLCFLWPPDLSYHFFFLLAGVALLLAGWPTCFMLHLPCNVLAQLQEVALSWLLAFTSYYPFGCTDDQFLFSGEHPAIIPISTDCQDVVCSAVVRSNCRSWK